MLVGLSFFAAQTLAEGLVQVGAFHAKNATQGREAQEPLALLLALCFWWPLPARYLWFG